MRVAIVHAIKYIRWILLVEVQMGISMTIVSVMTYVTMVGYYFKARI